MLTPPSRRASGASGENPRASQALTNPGDPSAAVAAGADHKLCLTCNTRYPEHFQVCPQDGKPLVKSDDMVGTTLGGTYLIVRILGEGGMGRVYEARHTRIAGKRFALKTLHQEYSRQADLLTRFHREAEAAAAIQSPYVVGVYDVDRTFDGRPFIVGEYLDGKELGDHLLEVGKVPLGFAVRIVRHVCKALAAAHARSVVHRDLKPENIFLTGDIAAPTAKVIDFGISRLDDRGGPSLTKTGMIMGTPSFMAPEQARGERVDHRADIYAVGAILYCALTGKRPFDSDDPTATLMAVLTKDPPRPRSIEPSIPADVELVIQRAMAKTVEDRYQTMAELDDALAVHDTEGGGPGSSTSLAWRPPADTSPTLGTIATVAGSTRLFGQKTGEIRVARSLIVLFSVIGAVWLVTGMATMIGGILRLGRSPTDTLTGVQSAVLVLGVTCALLGPALVAVWYVRRRVRNNNVMVFDLVEKIGNPVLVGTGAYGFATMIVVFFEAVLVRRAIGVTWPVWDVMLFLISLTAAAGTVVLPFLERRR
jgi:serine/threonine protein kinase